MTPSATCHLHHCTRKQDCLRYTQRDRYPNAPTVTACEDHKGFVPADLAAKVRWG